MEKAVQTKQEAEGRGKRYSEATKRQVVEELERGRLTAAQALRQYGIAGSQTIRGWQRRYGKAGGDVRRASALMAAQRRIERLEREKGDLERALAKVSGGGVAEPGGEERLGERGGLGKAREVGERGGVSVTADMARLA